MTSLQELRSRFDRLTGQRDVLESEYKISCLQVRDLDRRQRDLDEAKLIVQHVAQKTQQALEYRVSELVTFALSAVFDDPYEFKVEFIIRRDKTECDLWFIRNGEKADPMTASGGGVLDVAAFALRVSMWTLRRPRRRAILVLDEPFKHLKKEEQNRRAIQMVKSVSEKLGLQVLMISDERVTLEDIEAGADRIFRISKRRRNDEFCESKCEIITVGGKVDVAGSQDSKSSPKRGRRS